VPFFPPFPQPCTVAPKEHPIAPLPTAGRKPYPTVLLVDDDNAVRESLGRVLAGEPLHVIAAASGEEALRLIEQHEPDLIITDLCMAPFDGWDLLEREHKRLPHRPVFVITALPARETRGADHFAHEFFQKPLDLDALLAAIHRHLDISDQQLCH
jgi:DNA-binding NtrC family response regulator